MEDGRKGITGTPPEVRGARFTITEELFDDIISRALGVNVQVRHISNHDYMSAFQLTVQSDDERFPVLTRGQEIPMLNPILEAVKDEEGNGLRVVFKGFHEFSDTTEIA